MSDPVSVCVVGLGYVGLPTAAVISDQGISVTGVDTRKTVITAISNGETPIVEPDLDVLVQRGVASGYLKAEPEPVAADIFILAVPTPFKHGNIPDLSYLESAISSIAPVLEPGNLVILESTSPVGTTEKISTWITSHRPDLVPPLKPAEPSIYIAHSPERVLPSRILIELINNDRVIGGLTPACAEKAAEFYKLFVKGTCHTTSARTAEMVKLAENAYRDTNIAFANEMSQVCDKLGIDVWEMRELANRHPRVDILMPGPGVGGHCIAVDPWFIVHSARDSTPLLQAARQVNDSKPKIVAEGVLREAENRSPQAICCLGLSYKADIDDLRESPSIDIVKMVASRFDGTLFVVEPYIDALPEDLRIFSNLSLTGLEHGLEHSDIVVLLTDHIEFCNIPSDQLRDKRLIDTRGIWRSNG